MILLITASRNRIDILHLEDERSTINLWPFFIKISRLKGEKKTKNKRGQKDPMVEYIESLEHIE